MFWLINFRLVLIYWQEHVPNQLGQEQHDHTL